MGWSASGAAAVALLAAGCSAGAAATPYGTGAPAANNPPTAGVVDTRVSSLGRILVDGQGRTLYLFEADKAGKSACDGACATAWPPYATSGAPHPGSGVTGTLLGTTTRGDGGTQVTCRGHPLYYFVGDNQPGDTTGQGLDQFGAKWYVLAPTGNKIDKD